MGDQEFLQDEESMSILRSMHNLSKTAAALESFDKCTPLYPNSSTKGHSSSSPSQFQEPLPKIHTPFSPPCAAASPVDYHLLGYTKIQLPHSFPAASPPPKTPLRRTLSDPIYSPGTQSSAPQELIQFPNAVAAASTLTPPRPPAGRNSSRSPSFGGSRRTKRMKRMRERIRLLWNQVASEDGDEDEIDEHENCCCNDNNPKEESENDGEIPSSQEAVWVEKHGESLVLHFKCPCGNGYEVLLSGTSCYYKLTNF